MKRFGGFEFRPSNNTATLELINETTLNQLNSLGNAATFINATKVAALFRVYPPQASVNIWSVPEKDRE